MKWNKLGILIFLLFNACQNAPVEESPREELDQMVNDNKGGDEVRVIFVQRR